MISKLFEICILTGFFSSISILENVALVKGEDNRLIDSVVISQNDQKLETSSPSYVELDVPYFPQLDNRYEPFKTSNITALAMVLAYYGVQPKTPGGWLPNDVYQLMKERGWKINLAKDLVKVAREYGFQAIFKEKATWQEIRNQIIKGYPVIVLGWFTPAGHVVPLVGYTSTHFIANDSWGNANRSYDDKNGEKIFYSNQYIIDVNDVDNMIWAIFIYP